MIDIHGHFLCCGDDGAANEDETLEILEEYSHRGVTCVAATPHFIRGSCEIESEKILSLTEKYNNFLKEKNINLTIMPGMEVEMCHEIPGLFKAGKLLTLNNQGKYMLIELPFHSVPSFTQQIFYELKLLGITPILAHPERNRELCEQPEPIWEMVRKGVLMQINAGSLLGYFGSRIRKRAVSLIESNLVHLVASDAHQAHGERGPCLHLVQPVLERLVGREKTQVLLNHNPQSVLVGEKVAVWETKSPKSGFYGFLNKILGK